MKTRKETSAMRRARSELCSDVIRCHVLEARRSDRARWLDRAMKRIARRFPQLSSRQLAKLERIGRRFIDPRTRQATERATSTSSSWATAGTG